MGGHRIILTMWSIGILALGLAFALPAVAAKRAAPSPPVSYTHLDVYKRQVLDTLGVGIAGSSATGMDHVRAAASAWGSGEEATIWGTRTRAPAPAAAFVNGTQVHNQEFDCLHEGAVVHAMATLLPAILAVAEREGGVSGQDLIAAVVAGLDIAAGLGLASRSAFRFFRPATAGGFGAVAGLAVVSRLDASRIENAFGLQYGQTSGTMQPLSLIHI